MKCIFLLMLMPLINFMPPDTSGVKCVITVEHELLPERDTVLLTHFRRVDKKYYVMLKDGTDRWVDDCFILELTR